MSKQTLTDRMDTAEEKIENLDHNYSKLDERFEDLKKWMSNGYSEMIISKLTTNMRDELRKDRNEEIEKERELRKIELEEKQEQNRVYGAERDRKLKKMITILTSIVAPVLLALLAAVLKFIFGS